MIPSRRTPPRPAPSPAVRAPHRRWTPAVAAALAAVAACSGGDEGGTLVADAREARARRVAAVIPAPTRPYRVVPVPAAGAIRGTVRAAGELPRDTTVRPTMDVRACGTSLVDRTIAHTGDRLGGVVVWLADVREGKPLPMTRRFAVTNVRCQLEPRVQAVIAGGTLNVRSADAAVHRTRVVVHGTDSIVARYQHNDFGQVVPDDRVLRAPGLLELRSEVHPWTRGFVAVFDHPYFAVTAADGAFSLADVPPGEYTLAAWHERLGRIERRVTVTAGAPTTVELTFGETPVDADSASEGGPGASRRTALAPADAERGARGLE